MSDPGTPTKALLRGEALARRDRLGGEARTVASAKIAERTAAVLEVLRPATVGVYRAFGGEVETGPIIAAAEADGCAVALATMIDRTTLVFRRHRPGDRLAPDALGILAPRAEAEITDPDLLIVPVTAFDSTGHRLGKGGGIYDRAIADFRRRGVDPVLVGIAFSVQEVTAIPNEPHDIRLDWIVTENQTRQFPKGR